MREERMTIATVDICSCGLVMHQLEDDDYGTLGAESGICCPDCGNETFTTVKQLQAQLDTAKERIRLAQAYYENDQYADLGRLFEQALKEVAP